MNFKEKNLELKEVIDRSLRSRICSDYVLLDLPYYLNIGDTLIWEGELELLNTINYKCLNKGFDYNNLTKINNDTLILLQGGGNFGDLWRQHQVYRLDIIEKYPNNKILIFPITVGYNNIDTLKLDAQIMSKHKNLTICARDNDSFAILNKYFSNEILLVPDMAFYIPYNKLMKYRVNEEDKTLFLKRIDKELLSDDINIANLSKGQVDIHDWPSFETEPFFWTIYRYLLKVSRKVEKVKFLNKSQTLIIKNSDLYFHSICRQGLIKLGVKFVSQYKTIYSTRLHVAILSVLLHKKVTLIDNSYGKNSSYYKTWLSDLDGVEMYQTK